jgi:hypothetical protein
MKGLVDAAAKEAVDVAGQPTKREILNQLRKFLGNKNVKVVGKKTVELTPEEKLLDANSVIGKLKGMPEKDINEVVAHLMHGPPKEGGITFLQREGIKRKTVTGLPLTGRTHPGTGKPVLAGKLKKGRARVYEPEHVNWARDKLGLPPTTLAEPEFVMPRMFQYGKHDLSKQAAKAVGPKAMEALSPEARRKLQEGVLGKQSLFGVWKAFDAIGGFDEGQAVKAIDMLKPPRISIDKTGGEKMLMNMPGLVRPFLGGLGRVLTRSTRPIHRILRAEGKESPLGRVAAQAIDKFVRGDVTGYKAAVYNMISRPAFREKILQYLTEEK